jgi:uncharacterized protein YdeI (YjbR/CyaY-like superfamily)
MDPVFFPTPAKWCAWLAKHHASKAELLVGFYKRDSGKPSITWPESVDEALCFGWIDGVRRSLGAESYTIRFTPRKTTSTWSAVNIRRMAELEAAGRVMPAGRRAFAARRESKSAIYAYEQDRKTAKLPAAGVKALQANPKAWAFYQKQPPWYQRVTSWWIISAKKPETRARRLGQLIDDCVHERTVKQLQTKADNRR